MQRDTLVNHAICKICEYIELLIKHIIGNDYASSTASIDPLSFIYVFLNVPLRTLLATIIALPWISVKKEGRKSTPRTAQRFDTEVQTNIQTFEKIKSQELFTLIST